MADAIDDKKAVEATGADAAYDVLEKDFQEVRRLNGARSRDVAYDPSLYNNSLCYYTSM